MVENLRYEVTNGELSILNVIHHFQISHAVTNYRLTIVFIGAIRVYHPLHDDVNHIQMSTTRIVIVVYYFPRCNIFRPIRQFLF